MAVGECPFLHGDGFHTGGQGANLGGALRLLRIEADGHGQFAIIE